MSISTRTRFEVLKRDGFACRYCGRAAPDVELHVDHVVAKAAGGPDVPANLVASCAACNLGKAAVPLTLVRDDRASPEEVREAIARREAHAAQLSEYLRAHAELKEAEEEPATAFLCYAEDALGRLHGSWYSQVDSMMRKHPIERLVEAVDITALRGPVSDTGAIRYFYGVLRRLAESTK